MMSKKPRGSFGKMGQEKKKSLCGIRQCSFWVEKKVKFCSKKKHCSSGAQYVTLKLFLTSKFSYLNFFPTPPIKLKLGSEIDERSLLVDYMDQSLWLTNEKQGPPVKSYLVGTLCMAVRSYFIRWFYCAFHQPQDLVEKWWAKTIFLSQNDMFWLFFIHF